MRAWPYVQVRVEPLARGGCTEEARTICVALEDSL